MRFLPTLTLGMLLASGAAQAHAIKVADLASFNAAVPRLHPGDTLVLAAGPWRDAQLVFQGNGTEKQPIVLRAEQPGAVKMVGQSSLRLGGEWLVVTGLDFRDGYSPKGGVVEFRAGKNLAFNCRVTECVIDSYNVPTGTSGEDGIWIKYFGQHNRFDHNYVAGKKTNGTTMAVDLADTQSRENYHRIDHNYFGPRPRLGSNGGETLRIGVSTYSLSKSHTILEENYFYHCNGEVEIVSIKSGENVVRNNVFEECEGSVVMRHGNDNTIEGNYFLGNGKEQTGGVRVINAGHHITGNYFADLTGQDFRGALVIMNGVPNSPLNRYSPVHDVLIVNNTFVNCDHVELCAGKDDERSAAPKDVTLKDNIFYGPKLPNPFKTYDDISGLTFTNNLFEMSGSRPDIKGLSPAVLTVQKSADDLLVPTAKDAPKTTLRRPVTPVETGPHWFKPTGAKASPRTGKVWPVPAGKADELRRVCQSAKAGDIIELTQVGLYPIPQTIVVTIPVTVRAKAGLASRPVLAAQGANKQALFTLENGGSLRLAGLALDGVTAGGAGLIQPSAHFMLEHYNVWASDCAFYNLKASDGSIFRATTGTFADTLQFVNCLFYELGGAALSLATETQDKGSYNAEYVILRNCLFRNVQGSALDLYRGGNDESTLGPFLTVDHCTFDNVGNGPANPALKLTGVQWSDIRNSLFSNSAKDSQAIKYKEFGKAKNVLQSTNFYQSGKVTADFPPQASGVTYLPTDFIAPQRFDYRLKKSVTHVTQLPTATDGRQLGFQGRQ